MKSCWRSRHRRRCRNCRTQCRRWPRKDFDRVKNLRLHEFLPLHFVKHNIPGYNNFLPFRNPNLPLVRTSVSNQLSLLRMTIQLHTLLLRYMNKSIATKNTKVGEIRLLPMPCLEGCLVIKSGDRRVVFEIDYVAAISTQRFFGSSPSAIIALTLSMIVRFARSATPF